MDTNLKVNLQTANIFTSIDFEATVRSVPGYIYWKNKNSVYMGCNENMANVLALNSPEEIVGKTDHHFAWSSEKADDAINADKYVMKTGQKHISEHIVVFPVSGAKTIIRTEKYPLFNNDGKTVGVLAIAKDMSNDLSFMHNFLNSKLHTEEENLSTLVDTPIKLTKRQYEILYLLIMGKSPRHIAEYISNVQVKSVTAATVTSIINKQLYQKFNVDSVTKLIEKALLLKIASKVPPRFITN